MVVSTDKGLCGALNSNLFREAGKLDKDTTVFVTAGKKARSSLEAKASEHSAAWSP
jgi:F-type H+-transporting ATPase subunit gamma